MSKKPDADIIKQVGAALLMLAFLIPFSTRIGQIYVDPSDPGFGSRDLPRLIVAAGIILSLVLLARATVRLIRGSRPGIDWLDFRVRAAGVAAVAAMAGIYIWAISLFQYALPTLVLMIVMVRFFGSRGPARTVLVPVGAVAVYYFVFFVLFGIYEEPGTLLSYDSYSFARSIRGALGLR